MSDNRRETVEEIAQAIDAALRNQDRAASYWDCECAARAVLNTPEIERLIVDAYKRGFEWCVENAQDAEYLRKAAFDYADATLSHFTKSEDAGA